MASRNNRFFHIEHLIEVTGPLAQLESLVIPSRTTAENIIENINTSVNPEYRDRRTLTLKKAYERTNLPPIDLNDYNLRNVPEIQTTWYAQHLMDYTISGVTTGLPEQEAKTSII